MSKEFSVLVEKVVTSLGEVSNSCINISNGIIDGISVKPAYDDILDMRKFIAIPGFIDIHTHGYFGVDAFQSDGDEILNWAEKLAKIGVTSFVPTCVSLKFGDLTAYLSKIRKLMSDYKGGRARILGARSEGPYISMQKKGAHNPANIRHPENDEIGKLSSAFSDVLRIIDMAPELDGFFPAMSVLENAGIRVSIGHTNGEFSQISRAISSGARLMTHFYNAMTQFDHRLPGSVGAGLLGSGNYLEIIADFHHVSKEAIEIMARMRGWDHIIAVTDSLSIGGTSSDKSSLGGLPVEVHNDVAWIEGTNTIAGSVLTMPKAFSNLLSMGTKLNDLVKVFSSNPARILGLMELGDILPGKRADINFLDRDLKIAKTMLEGIFTG